MKNVVIAAFAAMCLCARAEKHEFRLVFDTETGDTTLVGHDCVRRCHILTEQEYQFVTNMVLKWCAHMNSTKEGRVALHGKAVGGVSVTTADDGTIVKRQVYDDGYVHEEKSAVKKRRANAIPFLPTPCERPMRHPPGISQLQKEMREARERIRQKKPKETTVNHDANTGKDTVVK